MVSRTVCLNEQIVVNDMLEIKKQQCLFILGPGCQTSLTVISIVYLDVLQEEHDSKTSSQLN